MPVRYSPQVRKMFTDLVNLITPGPLANFVLSTSDEIDPSFYEEKKKISVEQPEDVKRYVFFSPFPLP